MSEISRRRMLTGSLVLAGAAGGAVFGVTRPVHHKIAVPPPAPPPALTMALTDHRALLASYVAVAASGSAPAGSASLRADVALHVDALRAALEAYPGWRLAHGSRTGVQLSAIADSPTGSASAPTTSPAVRGSAPAATVTALRAQVIATAARLRDACLGWPAAEGRAGEVVPLLGSISACLSTHAEVLA